MNMTYVNMLLVALLAFLVGRTLWLRRGIIDLPAFELQQRLAKKEKIMIIDVREPWEFKQGHIPQAMSAPIASLREKAGRLDKAAEVVLVCASGNRSRVAFHQLKSLGFANLRNLPGGMSAWNGPVTHK